MKTIGVLGGMGSWATHHFFGLLIQELQATGMEEREWPEIVIDNLTWIPSRTLAVKNNEEDRVTHWIASSFVYLFPRVINLLLAVPCNQAHYWYDKVKKRISYDPRWLNMIEIVSNEVKAKGYNKPLILGGYVTVTKRLYSEYLPGAVYPSEEEQGVIENFFIPEIKNGKNPPFMASLHLLNIVDEKDCDCVILACTELSMVRSKKYIPIPIFDSSSIYAREVVKEALR